jgi:uncharacterized membrane protein
MLVVKAILGSIFLLFIPGFAWSFVFFPRRELDAIERIALSFGLSIAIVPITIFLLNRLAGVAITPLSAAIAVGVLTAIPVAYYYLRIRARP